MSPAQTHHKAKSRLARVEPSTPTSEAPENKSLEFAGARSSNPEKYQHHLETSEASHSVVALFWSSRLKFLILLFLGVLGYALCAYILRMVHPAAIANILFYNSYLPLLGVVLLSNFFFFSFLFLHTRRAFLLSFMITVLLFFKLQAVVLTFGVVGTVLGTILIIELLLSFIFKK